MNNEQPSRLSLARTPTPLVRLESTSRELGIELLAKRDDLTGAELTGNKIRKLEFLLADAQAQGADVVLTCGGEQSNHCRATAVAARTLGIDSVLFLRTGAPLTPPSSTGNILLSRMVGAELRWISKTEYGQRATVMESAAAELRALGRSPYVIPEGGSNALGSWGYFRAAGELANDLSKLPKKRTTIVYACGSGGTGAGLTLGAKLTDLAALDVTLAGVNVCDNRDYFVRTIGGLCRDFDQQFGTKAEVKDSEIGIIDGYVGLGYARSRPEELREIVALARRDAIVLDPVYTGKAFFGMTRELAAGRDFGDRIVFLHTGGIFGLLAKADDIAAEL